MKVVVRTTHHETHLLVHWWAVCHPTSRSPGIRSLPRATVAGSYRLLFRFEGVETLSHRRRCVELLEPTGPEFRMRQSHLENCRASTSILFFQIHI